MSIDATRWAWSQRSVSATQKLILLSLADRAGEDHECRPSIQRLEMDTGLNRKTIMANIAKLAAVGLVEIIHRRDGAGRKITNTYRLIGVSGREQPVDNLCISDDPSPKTGTRAKSQNGDMGGASENGDKSLNENEKEGSKPSPKIGTRPKSQNRDINLLDIYRERGVREDLWDAFMRERMSKGCTNSPYQIKLLYGIIDRAIEAGHDVNEMIEQSVVNSWKSLYPKNNGGKGEKSSRSGRSGRSSKECTGDIIRRQQAYIASLIDDDAPEWE